MRTSTKCHRPVSPLLKKTRIDPAIGTKHHTTEVWPEKIRGKTGIPGVIVEGSVEANRDGWHGAELKVGVKIELRGPVAKKKKKLSPKPVAPHPVPQEVQEKIAKRVERTKNHFPVPIGKIPDEVPEPKAVAAYMAAELMEAALNGKNSIRLDVPYYRNDRSDQPAALEMMREIGQFVRSELGPQAESVQRLTVTFGSNKQGGTVSISD